MKQATPPPFSRVNDIGGPTEQIMPQSCSSTSHLGIGQVELLAHGVTTGDSSSTTGCGLCKTFKTFPQSSHRSMKASSWSQHNAATRGLSTRTSANECMPHPSSFCHLIHLLQHSPHLLQHSPHLFPSLHRPFLPTTIFFAYLYTGRNENH